MHSYPLPSGEGAGVLWKGEPGDVYVHTTKWKYLKTLNPWNDHEMTFPIIWDPTCQLSVNFMTDSQNSLFHNAVKFRLIGLGSGLGNWVMKIWMQNSCQKSFTCLLEGWEQECSEKIAWGMYTYILPSEKYLKTLNKLVWALGSQACFNFAQPSLFQLCAAELVSALGSQACFSFGQPSLFQL